MYSLEDIKVAAPKKYKYVGECNGNDGNGCFMESCGHNCGCYKKVEDKKI